MGTLNSAYPSTSVILPRIWLCRDISHTNIAGFTFWLRESASSSGLAEWFSLPTGIFEDDQ